MIEILSGFHWQDTAAATVLALEHDALSRKPGTHFLRTAGAGKISVGCQFVNPGEPFQEDLLPLQEAVSIPRMHGIVLGVIEIKELGYILPAAYITKLKVIMMTIEFLKAQSLQLVPSVLLVAGATADAAVYGEPQAGLRAQDRLPHPLPAGSAAKLLTLPPGEQRHIQKLHFATALAIQCH